MYIHGATNKLAVVRPCPKSLQPDLYTAVRIFSGTVKVMRRIWRQVTGKGPSLQVRRSTTPSFGK